MFQPLFSVPAEEQHSWLSDLHYLAEAFLADRHSGRPETKKVYRQSLKQFDQTSREKPERELFVEVAERHFSKPLWGTSQYRKASISHVKMFQRWLASKGYLAERDSLEFLQLPSIAGERGRLDERQIEHIRTVFTNDELLTVLDYCRDIYPREWVSIQVAYDYALRLVELIDFGFDNIQKIDDQRGYVFLRFGKSQIKSRQHSSSIVRMSDELVDMVRDQMVRDGTWRRGGKLVVSEETGRPFARASRHRYADHVARIFQRAIGRSVNFHYIRRSRVTNLLSDPQKRYTITDICRVCSISPNMIPVYDKQIAILNPVEANLLRASPAA